MGWITKAGAVLRQAVEAAWHAAAPATIKAWQSLPRDHVHRVVIQFGGAAAVRTLQIMKPGETPVEPAPRSTVERVKDKLPFVKKKPTPGARNIR